MLIRGIAHVVVFACVRVRVRVCVCVCLQVTIVLNSYYGV